MQAIITLSATQYDTVAEYLANSQFGEAVAYVQQVTDCDTMDAIALVDDCNLEG